MILIVFGLPGTGKTFFSTHLADEMHAVHINTDVIRNKYNKKGQYDEQTKQFVYDQLQNEMRKHLRNGLDVVLDGTFHKADKRNQIKEEALARDLNLYFIEIKADEALIKKRLEENRPESEANMDVYYKLKTEFEPLEEPHLVLRSGLEDVVEMVATTKQYIYER